MAIHHDTVPSNNRINYQTVCQNIFFKLTEFFFSKRRYSAFKLRINFQIHIVSSIVCK